MSAGRLLAGLALLSLAPVLTACDAVTEAIDPCSKDRACEVDGPALIVDSMVVDAPTIQEIGMPAVPAGAKVDVSFTVLNHGSEATDPDEITVYESGSISTGKTVQLPGLKPGERYDGSVQIQLVEDYDHQDAITADLAGYGFTDRSLQLLVEEPDLVPTVQLLASEAQVATTMSVAVTVENRAYVADAGAAILDVCVRYSTDCRTDSDPLSVPVAAIAAGATWTDTVSFALPLNVLSAPDVTRSLDILVKADARDVIAEADENNDRATAPFTALPNLDLACGAQSLAIGGSASGSLDAADCELDATGGGSDLYRVTAGANQTLSAQVSAFSSAETYDDLWLYVLTPRGAVVDYQLSLQPGDTFTFTTAEAGDYYIAATAQYGASGQTYGFTLTQP